MGEVSIIFDLITIFSFSIIVVYTFNKLKIPPIIGFIITGLLIGPNGFSLVSMEHEVEIFSEIGIILILFSVGLDFSVTRLLNMKRLILLGGFSQVILTILLIIPIELLLGFELNQSIFIGFLISLSSTAIILKLLINKGETDTPQGRIAIGILIFQDLVILPMFLVTPILAGKSDNITLSLIILVLKILGIFLFIFISIRFVMPKLIFNVAKTKVKELFLFIIILICLLSVFLAEISGISIALGAFIAGLIISETEYSHEALGFIEPLRDVFGSIFFVSIGMIFNISIFIDNFWVILAVSGLVIIIKALGTGLSVKILGYPMRIIFLVSLMLAQVGEFSFVLSKVGLTSGIINRYIYDLFIAVAVITMILTPLFFIISPKIVSLFIKKFKDREKPEESDIVKQELNNHLIIVGFGINGKNLAKASKYANLQYVIVEMNPITVKNEKAKGEPIYFGDASKESMLEIVSVRKAKICVIAISDPAATRAIISIAKKINPNLYIIARTRFTQEVEPLYSLGADEVIPEEFETSVEIFTRVLIKYLIPIKDIKLFIKEIRRSGYEVFRTTKWTRSITDLKAMIPDHSIAAVRVSNDSDITDKTLSEINFRNQYELTLLAVNRDGNLISNPGASTIIQSNDLLIVWGNKQKIRTFEDEVMGSEDIE
mgnify:CR=1 FL=1